MRMNDTFEQIDMLSAWTIQLANATSLKVFVGRPAYSVALQHLRGLYCNDKNEFAKFELFDIKNLLAVIKNSDNNYRTQQCCNRMIYIIENIVDRLNKCNCDAICRNSDETHEGRYLDQLQRRYVAGA